MRTSFFSLPLAALVALSACGDSATDDGKYHPATDGKSLSEGDACSKLANAQSDASKALSCSLTATECPNLVRLNENGATCEYDNGTITGCAAYYAKATSCDDLSKAIDDCVYVTISCDK